MSPAAGQLLVNRILPLICGAIGRGRVKPVGTEDRQELESEGTAIAAAMLHSAESRGKRVTAGNVAHYTLQTLKSGRRSCGGGRYDAMGSAATADRKVSLVSMDEARGVADDDPDGEISLHDLLASPGDDGGALAGRRIDWADALGTMDTRMAGVVLGTAEGIPTSELATRYNISAPRVCQVREAAGDKIAEAWGGSPVQDTIQEVAWTKHVRSYTQRRTARAARAAKSRAR